MNIVLVEPEIPQNTGNIARTCAAVGAKLHLIKPLGFSLDTKQVKRAGLDYWHLLDLELYESLDHFYRITKASQYVYVTTKAPRNHTEMEYQEGCYLLFGKETAGLPESLLAQHSGECVRIPMCQEARSLNLSNAVAVVAYEVLRQHRFAGLRQQGKLGRGARFQGRSVETGQSGAGGNAHHQRL